MNDLIVWIVGLVLFAIGVSILLSVCLYKISAKICHTDNPSPSNEDTVDGVNVQCSTGTNAVDIVPPSYTTLVREENLKSYFLSSDSYNSAPTPSISTLATSTSYEDGHEDMYINHFLTNQEYAVVNSVYTVTTFTSITETSQATETPTSSPNGREDLLTSL